MAINYHHEPGTILICHFDGFKEPEITKRRPVVVLSPRLRTRGNLCTIVPCSTTAPIPVLDYHVRIKLDPPLPYPYNEELNWVKADMIYTVSFERLFYPSVGKGADGKRMYDVRRLPDPKIQEIRAAALRSLSLDA